MGLRETLLGATAPPTETVWIPQLGVSFTLRGMTGAERDKYEGGLFIEKKGKRIFNSRDLRAKMVGYCCIDEKGNRLLSDADVEALGAVRADVIDRLFGVAQRLSGMRDEDVDELGIGSESPIPSAIGSSPSHSS